MLSAVLLVMAIGHCIKPAVIDQDLRIIIEFFMNLVPSEVSSPPQNTFSLSAVRKVG